MPGISVSRTSDLTSRGPGVEIHTELLVVRSYLTKAALFEGTPGLGLTRYWK